MFNEPQTSAINVEKQIPIKFGTDGWRAVISDGFTFANLERVAQAFADYVKVSAKADQNPKNKKNECLANKTKVTSQDSLSGESTKTVVIGYDCRFLSKEFAECTARVLAGNGIKVNLFAEAVPTPLVSWSVCKTNSDAGIVITASHNPPEFNGFKIKASFGGSAPASLTQKVESFIDKNTPQLTSVLPELTGKQILDHALVGYRLHIENFFDLDRICSAKNRVVIDPMHGSGGVWVESFLKGGNLESETIRAERDPLFGGVHPEPIDHNLGELKTKVIQSSAILGIATDGDADRIGAVNEQGQTMTMHEVAPLLLLHLARVRGMKGSVVTTFSQSVLFKRVAASHNLPVFETPIGFKYIADLMLKENILIGAEESGGIGIQGHIPERDGIFNSLLLLEAVVSSGKTPSEIVRDIHREFGEFYYNRTDLKMDVARGKEFVKTLSIHPPSDVAGFPVTEVKTIDGTKLLFADESWLLFRQSGTEPVLRIYSEATSMEKREKLLEAGSLLALRNMI